MNSSTSSSKISKELVFASYIAAVAIVGYNGLVMLHKIPSGSGTSQNQENTVKMEWATFGTKAPPLVLVGSSLTANLNEKLVDPHAVNLGLGGFSAIAPLLAMEEWGHAPKVVMIEMGFSLMHGIETASLEQLNNPFTHLVDQTLPGMRTEYQPINVLATELRKKAGKTLAKERPVPEAVRQKVVARVAADNQTPLSDKERADLATAFDSIDQAITTLRARGSIVMLVSIPGEPAVDATPRRSEIRRLAHERFPNSKYEWVPDLPGVDWRTNDGNHLIPSDAAKFASYLHQVYQARVTGGTDPSPNSLGSSVSNP